MINTCNGNFVEVKTGAFVRLFSDLDSCLDKLGLLSYGICDTTLEEVFLKVADATGMLVLSDYFCLHFLLF